MILNVTVNVNLDEVTDPANIITRVTEGIGVCMRDVEGVTSYQISKVTPEDPEPPSEGPAMTTPEETLEDV
ncbi:hypothetical protein QEH42_gp099 [Microbacterium phage Pumpernickel]|uniref:Uncharacterized protein n=1 Tax=Microbacterium phage Pumpernickel TaxID=2885983 RepID=A0AAE8Y746_9CAUD|nr:hypothetical protein QEH42_gp099 [Microbacterium phage Pumpernickel]UDL15890.1 hypothetical protein SEA_PUMPERNICKEL_99 [Microbacterium phage Pumpernickel]